MSNNIRFGAVIYINELNRFWVEQAKKSGISILGLHPIGGKTADKFIGEAIDLIKKERFKSDIKALRDCGIAVEYEMHALSFMIPRRLFSIHPDWFRMDENGNRVSDFNICPSSVPALDEVSDKAAVLAELFPSDTHDYHFWIDDVANTKCHCPLCRSLSASDQALIIYNAIARGIKRSDPLGRQSYLAYCGTAAVPVTICPEKNIFLEFAPFNRDLSAQISDKTNPINANEIAPINSLLDFFGTENARILDYWFDNSLLSDWKMPMKKFIPNTNVIESDIRFYIGLGFRKITGFACYLGEDYKNIYGEVPNISFNYPVTMRT